VLGGGWARGRIANIVGDKSVGKSLCAIEACANFARLEKKGQIFYRESEAAFDISYAEALGLPTKRVDFGPDGIDSQWDTVEEVWQDLQDTLSDLAKAKAPGLYIVDSLDALSSRAEMERTFGTPTFGGEKAKMMGEGFRKLVRQVRQADLALIFISQIRDKIGIVFGEKHTRTGGKALDFYASQIVWLTHLKTLTQTHGGVKRPTAVRIKAKCKKNKVGVALRECEFILRFGFGIEDVISSLDWLEQDAKALRGKELDELRDNALRLDGKGLVELEAYIRDKVLTTWDEVESRFVPKRRKYG